MDSAWYELAADLTALAHAAFVALVIFGALLGRSSRFWRIAHIFSMTYGVLIEIFYWNCPLTLLEQFLRLRAGQGMYSESFIAHYVNQLLYLDVPQWSLIAGAAAVLGTNLALYLIWSRGRHRFPATS